MSTTTAAVFLAACLGAAVGFLTAAVFCYHRGFQDGLREASTDWRDEAQR